MGDETAFQTERVRISAGRSDRVGGAGATPHDHARGHERAVLDALVEKLDHIHADVAAIMRKLGIWREACGVARPAALTRAPEKKRKHTPEARRRRR